ncbi:MAG TPA: hypothetical protein PKE03_04465 [Bacteroidales bacterium]|nr:hypothetical protein [Bacteroidales bacterium]
MIIAIAGVSQAGKSTLASKLRKHLGHFNTTILCQDEYVHEIGKIPQINGHVNWEHPDSIDHEKLRQAIEAASHASDYVIVEGLMMFWDEATRKLFDRCIFLEIDKQTFIRRKSVDDRWGIEPEWYIDHIWQSYLRFGQPPEGLSYLRLDGRHDIDELLVISYIEHGNI